MAEKSPLCMATALLPLLGIETWHLRHTSALLFRGYVYRLWHAEKPVGVMLATAEEPVAEVTALLEKICNAILCKPQGGWVERFSEEFFGEADLFHVYLGKDIMLSDKRNEEKIPILRTYAPNFLLENPLLKREAWADLKPILRILKNMATV